MNVWELCINALYCPALPPASCHIQIVRTDRVEYRIIIIKLDADWMVLFSYFIFLLCVCIKLFVRVCKKMNSKNGKAHDEHSNQTQNTLNLTAIAVLCATGPTTTYFCSCLYIQIRKLNSFSSNIWQKNKKKTKSRKANVYKWLSFRENCTLLIEC